MSTVETLKKRSAANKTVAEAAVQGSQSRPGNTFEYQRSRTEFFARFVMNLPKSAWAITDAAAVCLGNYIGYQVFHFRLQSASWVADLTLVNAVVAMCFITSGVVFGLYEREALRHRARIVTRSLLTIVLAIALAYVVMHALMYEVYSRRIAMMGPLAFIGLSGSLRMLACRLIRNVEQRILFVGCGDSIQRVVEAIGESERARNFKFLGFVSPDGSRSAESRADLSCLGKIEDIQAICLANEIDEVVIGVEEVSNKGLSHLVMSCLRLNCRVTNQPTFHERVLGEVPADHISADWFLFADLSGHHAEHATTKRLADFLFSTVGLILSAPLWPLIALAIKLEDRGPVFYSQKRVGCHNRVFTLTKFRTMRTDAEADGHSWSVPGDSRVTRVGRFLRRSHLDELPQLLNIFMGDMSIVGPRPERPEFVEDLIQGIRYYDERHLVKPGLTGWAQINYGYGCSVQDAKRKLYLDLYYIKNMSMELDLVILFRTLGTLFSGPA